MTTAIEKSGKVEIILDKEKTELLKRTIAKGATDDEFALFLHQSKRTGLDPFSRQIHLVKRKRWNTDKECYEEIASIQVGIDGYRLIAERSGKYIPGGIEYKEKDGVLISAIATVFKIYDKPYPVTAEARLEEYCPRNKEGKPIGLWTKMPYLMLGKCAESLALRKAFPQELAGLYTDDEMPPMDVSSVAEKTEGKVDALKQKLQEAQAPKQKEAVPALSAQEPTAEEIQEEGAKVFGEDSEPPQEEPLTDLKTAVMRDKIEEGLKHIGIDQQQFYQACVHKFAILLPAWGDDEWRRAEHALSLLADKKYRIVVAKGQPIFQVNK